MANPPGYVPEFGQGLRANPQQPGTEGGKDWLKRQKLHKYWPMFSHWSYSDFMSISEENIKEKIQEIGATGMTNGARGKLVRCIKILNDRENVLLAIQRAVRANELFIADALLYLLEVVRTPLPTDPSYTISSTIIITYAEVKAYIASRKCIKFVHLKMSHLEGLIERRPALKAAMNLSIDMMRHDWHRQEDLPGNKEVYRRRILTEDSGYEEMITNPTEKPVENNSKWIVHPSGRPSGADSPGYEAHKYSQLARNIGTQKKYPQSYNYFHNFGSNGSNDTKSYPDTSAHHDLGQLHIKSYRITKSEGYPTLGKEETNISKPFQYNTSPIIKKTPNSYQNPVNRYQVKSNKAYNLDDKSYSSVLRSNSIGIKIDPQIYANAAGAIPKKSNQEKYFKKTDKNEGYKLSFPNPSLINKNERKEVANLYKELRKSIYSQNVPGYPSGMTPHWEVPSAERLYQHNITSSYPGLNRNVFNTRPSTPHSNEKGGIGSGCFYDLSPREYLFRHPELIPPVQTWKPLEIKQHVATNTNEGNWRNLVQFGDNNMASRTYLIDSNKPETNNLLNTTSMLVTEILEKVLDKDHVNQ